MSAIQQLITDSLDVWASAELLAKTGGRGRGAANGKSPHGIQKLRELILELAVRGKLVPQNPNDEPASVLLKRIAKEKSQLIKQGVIKNTKSSPEISNEDKPFDLPEGWEWARLPSVCDYMPGKTPSTKNPVFWSESEEGFAWVSIADMEHFGLIRESAKHITQKALDQVFKYPPIPAGSLLMSFKLTVGKIAILDVDAYHNEAIISIQPFNGISRDYLFKFLPSRALAGDTKRAIMGNTLNATSLSLLLIPVPPLAEQHRIVAKVDELMALCDQLEQEQTDNSNAHQTLVEILLATLTQAEGGSDFAAAWQRIAAHFDTLFTTEQSIDQLKQTLLQLAVMGKLVPQDPNDESAASLIKKLNDARDQWLKTHSDENPECSTMIRKLKKLTEPVEPFTLPDSWKCVHLIQLSQLLVDCHNKTAPYAGSGIPIIRTTNIRNREFNLDGVKFVTEETYAYWSRRCPPQQNDIMFTREAPMGEAAVIPDGVKWCLGQRTMLIRPMHKFVSAKFILLALTEPHLLERASEHAIGSTVKHLRVGDVENLNIPVPPLAEQHRIVAKVDELMAICDALKARLNEAQITQVQLADALVEQAVV